MDPYVAPLSDPPSLGPVRSTIDELALARLRAMQERDEPQHGLANGRDLDALRRHLARGTPESHLAALWDWSAVADDPLVAGAIRGGWRRWSGLLKGDNGNARLTAAVAWHAAGRPKPDVPKPARPRGRRNLAAELLALEASNAGGAH